MVTLNQLMNPLLNLIKNFFKKEEKEVKTNLSGLPNLLEQNFKEKKVELENFSAKKMSEVKYLHSKTKLVLQKIKETKLEKKEDVRLNHAVETSKKQLINQLEKLIEKINPTIVPRELNQYKEYSKKSYAILVQEINSFRKNIVYTSIYHKEEMKELGDYFQSILNNLNELNQKIDSTKEVFEYEGFKEKVTNTLQKKKELTLTKKSIIDLTKKIKEKKLVEQKKGVEINQKKLEKNFLEVKQAKEELTNLANEKQDLKLQLNALILNIDRPLNRYKLLIDSNRIRVPIDEVEVIHLFTTNPLLALKKDPKAEKFKKVLDDVKTAISEGRIELKEKEKEKRIEAINEIQKYDFFEKVFWRTNELQKKQLELNKLITTNPITRELEALEEEKKEIERELIELEGELNLLEKQRIIQEKNILQETESAKNFVQTHSNQKIILEE